MNGVDALAQIALKDHTARSSGYHFHLQNYAHVFITVSPLGSASTFDNDIATLCIYYGIEDMVRKRKYKEAELDCYWDNVEIARVVINDPITTTSNTVASNSFAIPTVNNTTDALSQIDDPIVKAVRPRFGYFPDGIIIDIPTACLTVMYSLAKFSRQRATDAVPRCSTDPGPEWNACMVFPADGPIRTRPPFLEYRWVIESIRQIPEWMKRHGRFANLAISFWVDGINLGGGILVKGKPWQATQLLTGANVATS
ncbi:MAG: hypothetical protein Q9218_003099 [Villophora microphyllina]